MATRSKTKKVKPAAPAKKVSAADGNKKTNKQNLDVVKKTVVKPVGADVVVKPAKQEPAKKKAANQPKEQSKKPAVALSDILSDNNTPVAVAETNEATIAVALPTDADNDFVITDAEINSISTQVPPPPVTSPLGEIEPRKPIPLSTEAEQAAEVAPLELATYTERMASVIREESKRKIMHDHMIHEMCVTNAINGYIFHFDPVERSITGKIGTSWHKVKL